MNTSTTLQPNLFCNSHPIGSDLFAWEHGGDAVKLLISDAAKKQLAAIPKGEANIKESIIAFDHIGRKWWAIRHFPCFIDCFDCCCAAQAQEVEGRGARVEWEEIEFPDTDVCPCCGEAHH